MKPQLIPTVEEVDSTLAQIEQRESPRLLARAAIARHRSVAVTDLIETRQQRQRQVWDRQRMAELDARHAATFSRVVWWRRLIQWLKR